MTSYSRIIGITRFLLLLLLLGLIGAWLNRTIRPAPMAGVLDLSGLAWIQADTFLAVHDAKLPLEKGWPRVSLLRLPHSPDGPSITPLEIVWPEPYGLSHDLESVARIPGTRSFLLVESGDDGTDFQRLFLADLVADALHIREVADWPVRVENVEGSAVAQVDDTLVFLFAERAHGLPETEIIWATLTLNPLVFGTFQRKTFRHPAAGGQDERPVSALEVDNQGRIYAASAYDPNVDDGPYRSAVWEIGSFAPDRTGRPDLTLLPTPVQLAILDGFKVESIAVQELAGGATTVFIGTDDENYGAAIRPLPTSLHTRGDNSITE